MKRLCAECGERAVSPRAVSGRLLPWKQFPSLAVPEELEIPTCANCGSEWIDGKTAERIDGALDKEAAAVMRRLAREAIDALSATIHQREIEIQLGLSAGYISKLKHGKETPSAQLVTALALLAARPARLEEVERIWETGHLPPRLTNNHYSRVALPVDEPMAVAN